MDMLGSFKLRWGSCTPPKASLPSLLCVSTDSDHRHRCSPASLLSIHHTPMVLWSPAQAQTLPTTAQQDHFQAEVMPGSLTQSLLTVTSTKCKRLSQNCKSDPFEEMGDTFMCTSFSLPYDLKQYQKKFHTEAWFFECQMKTVSFKQKLSRLAIKNFQSHASS